MIEILTSIVVGVTPTILSQNVVKENDTGEAGTCTSIWRITYIPWPRFHACIPPRLIKTTNIRGLSISSRSL